jgi:hypothetical protein
MAHSHRPIRLSVSTTAGLPPRTSPTSPHGLARFQAIGLCNSSTTAARAAYEEVTSISLSRETTCSGVRVPSARRNVRLRPYGFPADLAADADVEIVVCCTRIDVHYATVRARAPSAEDTFLRVAARTQD